MCRLGPAWLMLSLLLGHGASAQIVISDEEVLASDRPEAWAMNYVAASSFMTSFGIRAPLPRGQWGVALELGHVPGLSDEQQRVGFRGTKAEDLNKSPVFGRLRVSVGLPGGWEAEMGYTPPVTIEGTRARDLLALAISRRIFKGDDWMLSMRAFGQHGSAQGDVTCPGNLAGPYDPGKNPFGCRAASRDRISLNYYGADLTAGRSLGTWQWHAGLGAVRTELAVQVDALTFSVRDRSRLLTSDVLPYVAIGASRGFGRRWSMAAELLHVPLAVRRDASAAVENDPLTSLRLQWSYRSD